MTELGKQITALRREKEMTQETLANLIGVSAQTVSKWECGTTMPDILLLPVLADVFGVSIDALFGIERKPSADVLHTEKAEAAIDDLLRLMWCEGAPENEVNHNILRMRESLDANHAAQSMWLAPNYTGIYVDADIAAVCRLSREEQLKSLDAPEAARFLASLARPAVRRVMQYQLSNNGRAFTAETAAARCGIEKEEAEAALGALVQFGFTRYQKVELPDGDKPLAVYSLYGEHKLMPLAVLMRLADKLATWQEQYRGFNCP